MPNHEPLVFFLALFGLYSPVAALASYLPIIQSFSHAQVLRLSIGLTLNVAVFVLLAIWAGEPLLEVLGLSTAALTATGGIALAWEAIPLMTGHHAAPGSETAAHHTSTETMPEADAHAPGAKPIPAADAEAIPAADTEPTPPAHPVPSGSRSVLFLPLTFPLTVGGTTFAFGVAASASAPGIQEKALVSVAAICYALVTGVTLYAAGHVTRRISPQGMVLLDRIAGILLTAIAVILLVNGFTDMVLSRIHR
jgi:multiple antibiotic resistance protein